MLQDIAEESREMHSCFQTDLMQSTDNPSLSQGQLLKGPRTAEVCLG